MIEQAIFLSRRGKVGFTYHLGVCYDLEATMRERGKDMAAIARILIQLDAVVYVCQREPLGLDHTIRCAHELVGDKPRAVLLLDKLMVGTRYYMGQTIEAYEHVVAKLALALPDFGPALRDYAATLLGWGMMR